MLLFTEQFTGAADFHVLAGEHKAGAQVGGLLDGFQPFDGVLGHHLGAGGNQVGVGLVVAATHPATKLVKLGQAKLVGAIDDDGVGAGHIDAGFDDGGAYQHVETTVIEVTHHRFQFSFAHLPMGNANAGIRDQLANVRCGFLHGVDIVVQVIHLPAAQQFTQQRFLDRSIVVLLHKGLHRQAFLRRCGDDGNITHAAHGHVQGTRNRGGGEGENVTLGAHLFQAFLVAHPEAVFFVDNNQAQIVEGHGFLEQLVGAHQNIHFAFLEPLQHLGLFLGAAKARQHFYIHWPVGETVSEGFVMLLGEQGGGYQYRHLGLVFHGHEGGAHGHLGLAEAHVTADQPVHGLAGLHVGDH